MQHWFLLPNKHMCLKTNRLSSAHSLITIYYHVVEKPEIVEKSEDRIVKLGESVVLTVTAKGRDMEFNWVKHGNHPDDGITINPANDQNYEIESVLETTTLIVS